MDELAERIAARLHEALERQVAAGFYAAEGARGLAAPDLEEAGAHDIVRLSVEEAAGIAADEARR